VNPGVVLLRQRQAVEDGSVTPLETDIFDVALQLDVMPQRNAKMQFFLLGGK
jgi:hypothetical protein